VQSYSDPQTINRYSYCVNNPLKYVDPTGHFNVADDTGAWNAETVTVVVVPIAIRSGGIGIGFATIDDSQFAPQMPVEGNKTDIDSEANNSIKVIDDAGKATRMTLDIFCTATGLASIFIGVTAIVSSIVGDVVTCGALTPAIGFAISGGVAAIWNGYKLASFGVNDYLDQVDEETGSRNRRLPKLPDTGPLPWQR